jgi:hypothetical protein
MSKRTLRAAIEKVRKSFLLCAARACLAVALPTALALVAQPLIAQTRSFTGAARITRPIDETDRVTLKGNVYPAARPQADQGVAPAELQLDHMVLLLQRSNVQQAVLEKFLDDQQNVHSPSFHEWLTPAAFGEQFGVAPEDINTISQWLRSHGFTVESVSKGRTFITFSGSNAQLQAAFHTQIHRYVVRGEQHYANATDPEIPAALTEVIAGIISLDDFHSHPTHTRLGAVRKDSTTGRWKPVSPASFGPSFTTTLNGATYYGVTPYDFATIYNLKPLWDAGIDGTGQTIAIAARSDINTADIDSFRSAFGLPAKKLNLVYGGGDPGKTEDEDEADLDVEWSGAIAKNATIDLVISASTYTTDGIFLSSESIVDSNLAPVMSVSYGQCELALGAAGNQSMQTLWEQAAAQGISVMVAAGDGGSSVCDQGEPYAFYGLSVSGLASTPYNVAVGGTDYYGTYADASAYWNSSNDSNLASAISYIPEIPWNDSCASPQILAALQAAGSTSATTTEGLCNGSTQNHGPFLNTAGGSGGASNCITSDGTNASSCAGGYSKPAWQSGIAGIPPDRVRDLPDVSLFAGNGVWNSFYVYCESDAAPDGNCDVSNPDGGGYLAAGGTSFASPAFAGIIALVNQKTGAQQGNPNYVLYKLGKTQYSSGNSAACQSSNARTGNSCLFYDLTSGNNAVPCEGGTTDCSPTNPNYLFGILPGWNANAGYDLATGLGSVNAYNLVHAWSTASSTFLASRTTLTVNSSSAPYGSTVSGTIAVAAASGESGSPSGNVAVEANMAPNPSLGGFGAYTLANGLATFQVQNLPVGTYPISARYAGDATFDPSSSSGVQVTISPAKTTTHLIASESSLLSTQSVTFTATVETESFAAAPTGTVVLTDETSGAILGTASVTPSVDKSTGASVGVTVINTPAHSLIVGTNRIIVSYSGDGNYSSSTSPSIAITLLPMFSLSITPSSLTISGTGSGTATITVAPGGNNLTTAIYLSCGSGLPAGATCSFSPAALPPGSGMSTSTLTIQVSSPLPKRGSMPLADKIRQHGIEGASLATFACLLLLISPRRRRTHQLLALLAVSVMASMMACSGGGGASSRTTTTTLTSSAPNASLGSSVTFSAMVKSSAGAPTGAVTLGDGGTMIGTASLTNGTASFVNSSLSLGLHSIVATYNGDGTHEPSASATFSENVTLSAIINITATDALGNSVTSPLSVTIE